MENSARSFHSHVNLHSRWYAYIEGIISLFGQGEGVFRAFQQEQGFDHVVSNEPTRCLQSNIRSMWINVSKMKTFVVAREREREWKRRKGGEKSMNDGVADIIFPPCIIRNRGCRCRRVKISYVPGILVYIG